MTTWIEEHGRSCKIGTIPMVVRVHRSDWVKMPDMVGERIRVQYSENGPWETVHLNRVDRPDWYFQADK